METDPPSSTAPETSDDQAPKQGRFYECTFCKRGFSNAQALGGHMNIHRKDKAKLKQTSTDQAQQSLDIPKTAPSYFSISTNRLQSSEIKFGEERGTIKRPWILTAGEADAMARDKTHASEVHQLPLFVDTQSKTEEKKAIIHAGVNTEKGLSSSHGLSGSELDLELRLGHKPQDLSPKGDTKKIF
ncbi:hypothetical protein L1049_013438 [Liquidambar formosana]|uniref:C2H2-type domain-containing protein n=1 Tax=Liquidambar formosana TaxID=63359 RepID=A0AAP0RK96_LIQFO